MSKTSYVGLFSSGMQGSERRPQLEYDCVIRLSGAVQLESQIRHALSHVKKALSRGLKATPPDAAACREHEPASVRQWAEAS